jgi:hypothetical protein
MSVVLHQPEQNLATPVALGKHLNVGLEILNRVLHTLHLHELAAEAIQLLLAK